MAVEHLLANPIEALKRLEPGQPLLFHDIDWETLEALLEAAPSRRLRLAYCRGDLEIMSPLPVHEIYKSWFGYLLTVLALELGIRIKGCGSMTIRRDDVEQAVEPDTCFYLENAVRVRDWRAIDLAVDPPPDLGIEVDITNSSLDRLSIYASLRVPELWRFDAEHLYVYRLNARGEYESRTASVAFPFLPLDEMVPLLQQCVELADDGEVLRALQSWVRERVRPRWEAHARQASSPES